ncbi:PREDICTED: LEAF RUST 10 DISEASE-RESISTANCE LOCUS RECEPTOR-LIKE PROTEIN KINASE-like 2.8 [Camelina sativa]|uniref:non-specific serine/threonine protein kinase n=1 Tax=Camelina sativa TaxID=90675 RepID=A0ABM0WG12_CAMSA|nr:PREDICTED: LEAF RUST 10 DISEASE-RESISTANCE LOCUS RECEPTOR-LIKE PROTEIN KINASE-like 2.8 [Camelina sativa]
MYHLPTFCLIIFFIFSLIHPLPCASSNQRLGWCETPFQCGNITVGFPFSGGNRRKDCGHPLLQLHCNKNNITSLFISNQKYSVLHLDQTSNTLTLAKQDLLGSFCSSVFTNTTLPPETFELSPTYKTITVFYQCSSLPPSLSSYTCPDIGPISVSENPGIKPENCRSSFTLKVPTSFVTKEKDLNVTNLESVLRKGFEVKVVINENACQQCLSSHGKCHGFNEILTPGVKCHPPKDAEGTCGYNQTSRAFLCYCKDPYSLSCGSNKNVFVRWILVGVSILSLIGIFVTLVYRFRRRIF